MYLETLSCRGDQVHTYSYRDDKQAPQGLASAYDKLALHSFLWQSDAKRDTKLIKGTTMSRIQNLFDLQEEVVGVQESLELNGIPFNSVSIIVANRFKVTATTIIDTETGVEINNSEHNKNALRLGGSKVNLLRAKYEVTVETGSYYDESIMETWEYYDVFTINALTSKIDYYDDLDDIADTLANGTPTNHGKWCVS